MNGQISMFDFLNEIKAKSSEIIAENTEVWRVVRAEVMKYIVLNEKWQSNGKYIYRIEEADKNGFWTMPMDNVGIDFFLNKKDAFDKARQYLKENPDYILAKDIFPIEQRQFSYIRECDGREMISHYAILPDGKVYVKGFYTYAHIHKYENIEKARKELSKIFFNQQDFESKFVKEDTFIIPFKNMYRCKQNDGNWMYAEAAYGGCI